METSLHSIVLGNQPRIPTPPALPDRSTPGSRFSCILQVISSGNIEALKHLLSRGENVIFTLEGRTPLGVAILHKNLPMIQLLLEAGATIRSSYSPPHHYSLQDPLPIIELIPSHAPEAQILQSIIKLDPQQRFRQQYDPAGIARLLDTSIYWIGRAQDPENVGYCCGCSLFYCVLVVGYGPYWTPILNHEQNEIWPRTIHDADPPLYELIIDNTTMLDYTSRARNLTLTKMFLETYPKQTKKNPEEVANLTTHDYQTALHSIAIDLRQGEARFHPINIREATTEAKERELAIVKLLLDTGANVNARMPNGWTPLHVYSQNDEFVAISQLLIDYGADINARDMRQRTPLHTAIIGPFGVPVGNDLPSTPELLPKLRKRQNLNITRFLLDNGADIDAEMEDGNTALDVAMELGLLETAEILAAAQPKGTRGGWDNPVEMRRPHDPGWRGRTSWWRPRRTDNDFFWPRLGLSRNR